MITNDEFHRTMQDGFKEIRSKMDNLHTETMDKVKEIETKVITLESSYNTHIEVGEAINKEKSKGKITKNQKIGIMLGLVPISLALYSIFF